MGKFIEENWFKVCVLIVILIVALSVIYYFIFLLPETKKTDALLKNQFTCSQMEEKTLSNYKKQNDSRKQQEQETISSSNHYNAKLKKCIIEISDSTVSTYQPNPTIPAKYATITSVMIFDAVENVMLASCSEMSSLESPRSFQPSSTCNDSAGESIPTSQFDTIEKQYMTE